MVAVVILDAGGAVHDPSDLVLLALKHFKTRAVRLEDEGVALIVLADELHIRKELRDGFGVAADEPSLADVVVSLEIILENEVNAALALFGVLIDEMAVLSQRAQHGGGRLALLYLD